MAGDPLPPPQITVSIICRHSAHRAPGKPQPFRNHGPAAGIQGQPGANLPSETKATTQLPDTNSAPLPVAVQAECASSRLEEAHCAAAANSWVLNQHRGRIAKPLQLNPKSLLLLNPALAGN